VEALLAINVEGFGRGGIREAGADGEALIYKYNSNSEP